MTNKKPNISCGSCSYFKEDKGQGDLVNYERRGWCQKKEIIIGMEDIKDCGDFQKMEYITQKAIDTYIGKIFYDDFYEQSPKRFFIIEGEGEDWIVYRRNEEYSIPRLRLFKNGLNKQEEMRKYNYLLNIPR